MSLPHGAVGWTVVCSCGISWPYSFLCVFFLPYIPFAEVIDHTLSSEFDQPTIYQTADALLEL